MKFIWNRVEDMLPHRGVDCLLLLESGRCVVGFYGGSASDGSCKIFYSNAPYNAEIFLNEVVGWIELPELKEGSK